MKGVNKQTHLLLKANGSRKEKPFSYFRSLSLYSLYECSLSLDRIFLQEQFSSKMQEYTNERSQRMLLIQLLIVFYFSQL